MAGRIRALIDELYAVRGGNEAGMNHFLKAHLILNGIHPDKHTRSSEDDPTKIRVLEKMISDFRSKARR